MPRIEANTPPDLLAQVVAQSPERRARAEAIVDAFLDNVERAVKIGDPQTMATYARVILPGMIRALGAADEGDGVSKRRAASMRIRAALRGEVDIDEDES